MVRPVGGLCVAQGNNPQRRRVWSWVGQWGGLGHAERRDQRDHVVL